MLQPGRKVPVEKSGSGLIVVVIGDDKRQGLGLRKDIENTNEEPFQS